MGANVFVEDLKAGETFNTADYWHFTKLPSTFFGQIFLTESLSLQANANYSRYQLGKFAAGERTVKNRIISGNIQAKLHGRCIRDMGFFDPFLVGGFGYTNRYRFKPIRTAAYFNLGVGFDFWIKDLIGIGISTTTEFGLDNGFIGSSSNYQTIVFSASYKFKDDGLFRSATRSKHKWVKERRFYRFRRSNR